MFSWLFGGKKKKASKPSAKGKATGKAPNGAKPAKAQLQSRKRTDDETQQMAENLGGPQVLAMIIKGMLAEDKLRKKKEKGDS